MLELSSPRTFVPWDERFPGHKDHVTSNILGYFIIFLQNQCHFLTTTVRAGICKKDVRFND